MLMYVCATGRMRCADPFASFIKQRRGQKHRQGKKKTAHRYGKGKTQEQSSDQMESIGGEHNPVAKQREIIQMHDNSPGRGKHPNDKSKSPIDKVK